GTIPELPGAGRRTSVDRFAIRRAECRGCRARCESGGLALERPVGEESWGRCDPGHALALAGGTPGGLDRSSECAAEREGTGAAASERRERPTFRCGGVREADGERAGVGPHSSSGGPAAQAEKLAVSLFPSARWLGPLRTRPWWSRRSSRGLSLANDRERATHAGAGSEHETHTLNLFRVSRSWHRPRCRAGPK